MNVMLKNHIDTSLDKTKKNNFHPDEAFISDNKINIDISYIVNPTEEKTFISMDELEQFSSTVIEKHRMLKNCKGNCLDNNIPMLGWLTLPEEITEKHLDEVVNTANEFAANIDAFVSLGIGGSYLGIEATIKALTHTFSNQLQRNSRNNRPEIYFLGQNTDPDFIKDTLDIIDGKKIGINVISKSGTTTETAIAFRLLRKILEKKHENIAKDYIIATTDKSKGALRSLVEQKGYKSFTIPNNIGGRFSVLSDVGLFGLAVAGIDIHEFTAGFRHMKQLTDIDDFWGNPAMVHAAIRHLSYKKGKKIEVVATNSSSIYQLTRWMEQIFPESEGHNGFGMWVSPSMYSEKLHANGQMVQDGERNILETFIKLKEYNNYLQIPHDQENLDGLNYLPENDLSMNFINQLVVDGPAFAHFKGGTPNMTIEIPRRNPFNIGQFYFLMERSVALSGYLAGHNPFIQPGVESYKKVMFALAGKPGSEKDALKINDALKKMIKKVI